MADSNNTGSNNGSRFGCCCGGYGGLKEKGDEVKALKEYGIGILIIIMFTSCVFWIFSLFANKSDFSEHPFDDVYEVTYATDWGMVELTTKEIPEIEGNTLKVINYWRQEYDEEGNEEWIRYDSDYYFVLIPINDGVIVRHIPDIDNTASVVKMWTWRQYLQEQQ